MKWILSTSNYGRERIIEKLTWKAFLGNNISKETKEEDRDDILLSLVAWFCWKTIKYLSNFMRYEIIFYSP